MIGLPRMGTLRGCHSFVVRGTVLEVVPAKTTVRLWFFKETTLPVVKIRIDDQPFQQLLSAGHPSPTKEFRLDWTKDPMPLGKGVRVWATFSYSTESESYFTGVPRLTLDDIEVIKNEAEIREGEYM